jgi:hypothetical protein
MVNVKYFYNKFLYLLTNVLNTKTNEESSVKIRVVVIL